VRVDPVHLRLAFETRTSNIPRATHFFPSCDHALRCCREHRAPTG
jgi:hypothetical protein